MSGTLYVVPTPIGDLSDLSPRARRVLAEVDLVAAEDTRVTTRLYRDLGLEPRPMVSTHDHNEQQRAAELVRRLLDGASVALVSDAGTPLVSDPGYRVLTEALAAGIQVVVLPGPCAAVAALSGSGLPPDRFLFVGFLPRDDGPRARALDALRHEPATLLLYEAPHRIKDTLRAAREAWGDRPAALVRSLTKVWEEWFRGALSEIERALEGEEPVRGELTLVVGGFPGDRSAAEAERADRLIRELVGAGVPVGTVRDVVAGVYDLPRREVYQRALALQKGQEGDG